MSITKSAISRFIFGDKFAETQKLIGKKRKFYEESTSSSKMTDNGNHPLSDMSTFKNLLHDFSTGRYVHDAPLDFWDLRFSHDVCAKFNERSGRNYSVKMILDMGRELQYDFCLQRAAKDMKDEKLCSIFEACPKCRAKIPVFPTSLQTPSFISTSSGSGSGSRRRRLEYDCAYGATAPSYSKITPDDMAKIRAALNLAI